MRPITFYAREAFALAAICGCIWLGFLVMALLAPERMPL